MRTERTTDTIARTLEGDILTVRIPMTFKRIGGRKVIVAPEGSTDWAAPPPKPDNTLIRALARAHRWQKLLETGAYHSIEELAKAEKIDPTYIGRIIRLTLLAPEIIDGILDGKHPKGRGVGELTKSLPLDWAAQRGALL